MCPATGLASDRRICRPAWPGAIGFALYRDIKRSGERDALMSESTADPQRMRLSFRIQGLPLRDELVIRSVVRLLDHRTDHHWSYSLEQADLDVVGDACDEAATASGAVIPAGHVLRAGKYRKHDGPFLSLPVNSNALELLLNDFGNRINELKRTAEAATGEMEAGEAFRLLRWPPAALLDGSERMKMATIIMGRALSASALAQRAGVTVQECASYLHMLQANGYLAVNTVIGDGAQNQIGMTAPVKEKVAAGLLSRIRSRLGLTR